MRNYQVYNTDYYTLSFSSLGCPSFFSSWIPCSECFFLLVWAHLATGFFFLLAATTMAAIMKTRPVTQPATAKMIFHVLTPSLSLLSPCLPRLSIRYRSCFWTYEEMDTQSQHKTQFWYLLYREVLSTYIYLQKRFVFIIYFYFTTYRVCAIITDSVIVSGRWNSLDY